MDFRILIVDDEIEICLSLVEILQDEKYSTFYTTNPNETKKILATEKIDLIIMDIKMPELSGLDLLKMVKSMPYEVAVIMITGYPSVKNAVLAMKYGAVNFHTKPLDLDELLTEIKQLASKQQNYSRHDLLKQEKRRIISTSTAMKKIKESLEIAAGTDAPVLLTGESGTGKEMAAHALHYQSNRAQKPFIKMNCAAIPDSLLESELFGHEKGAFTDAKTQRKGKFELAHTGSIFLDEIGDMNLNTQAKILRVMQDYEFERIGGSKSIHADIRVITATNKNIPQLISAGKFREDLFYRLSVIPIHLPPLKERAEDILLLAHYFKDKFNRVYNKTVIEISEETETLFLSHNWPGNIRELKNCIERAIIFSKKQSITIEDLPKQYHNLTSVKPDNSGYEETLKNINRNMIVDALLKSDGVKQKAAKLLNIDRKTLYNRMKKLGMI